MEAMSRFCAHPAEYDYGDRRHLPVRIDCAARLRRTNFKTSSSLPFRWCCIRRPARPRAFEAACRKCCRTQSFRKRRQMRVTAHSLENGFPIFLCKRSPGRALWLRMLSPASHVKGRTSTCYAGSENKESLMLVTSSFAHSKNQEEGNDGSESSVGGNFLSHRSHIPLQRSGTQESTTPRPLMQSTFMSFVAGFFKREVRSIHEDNAFSPSQSDTGEEKGAKETVAGKESQRGHLAIENDHVSRPWLKGDLPRLGSQTILKTSRLAIELRTSARSRKTLHAAAAETTTSDNHLGPMISDIDHIEPYRSADSNEMSWTTSFEMRAQKFNRASSNSKLRARAPGDRVKFMVSYWKVSYDLEFQADPLDDMEKVEDSLRGIPNSHSHSWIYSEKASTVQFTGGKSGKYQESTMNSLNDLASVSGSGNEGRILRSRQRGERGTTKQLQMDFDTLRARRAGWQPGRSYVDAHLLCYDRDLKGARSATLVRNAASRSLWSRSKTDPRPAYVSFTATVGIFIKDWVKIFGLSAILISGTWMLASGRQRLQSKFGPWASPNLITSQAAGDSSLISTLGRNNSDPGNLANSVDLQEELTDVNFVDTIQKMPTFVLFYASWCPHCQQLDPAWKQLRSHLIRKGTNVQLARLDAERHKMIANNFGVTKYPMLLLFKNHGAAMIAYSGPRNVGSLVEFINENLQRQK